jgi:class 3 adenylate cyclase
MQLRAVNAAFAMRTRLQALNQRRIERGDLPIDNGIGIASGRVIAGQMGSPERCIYTVIGDTVNIAARIESMTREFPEHPILINDDMHAAIKDHPEIRTTSLGEHQVKGRKAPVHVYAVEPAQ